MTNLEEIGAQVENANLAISHLMARGPLPMSAHAAMLQLEFGVERLISDSELTVFIASQRIRLGAERLMELSGAATLELAN